MSQEQQAHGQLVDGSKVLILRVWHEETAGRQAFRAALREGTSGDRRYFATIDAVLEHLYCVLVQSGGSR